MNCGLATETSPGAVRSVDSEVGHLTHWSRSTIGNFH